MPHNKDSMNDRRPGSVVAVVDDDSSMLGATRDLLEASGFVTRVFASAEEFLQKMIARVVEPGASQALPDDLAAVALRRG